MEDRSKALWEDEKEEEEGEWMVSLYCDVAMAFTFSILSFPLLLGGFNPSLENILISFS